MHQSQTSGAVEAHNGASHWGPRCSQWRRRGWKWSRRGSVLCSPVVAGLGHFDEEQDPDLQYIRIKKKSRIRVSEWEAVSVSASEWKWKEGLDPGPYKIDADPQHCLKLLWYNFDYLEDGRKRYGLIFLPLLRWKIFENIKKKLLLSGQQGQEGDGGEAQPQHPRQLIHPRWELILKLKFMFI
jgi:hypothetical protein